MDLSPCACDRLEYSTRIRRRALVAAVGALLVMLVAGKAVSAQSNIHGGPVSVAIASPSGLIEDHDITRHGRIAVEGLNDGLASAGLRPIVPESRVSAGDDAEGDSAGETDRASSVDAAYRLEPRLEVRGRRVTLVATVYESESGAYIAGGVAQGLADVSLVETARELADELAPRIRRAAEVRAAGEPPQLPDTLVDLVFTSADENVRLTLGDNLDIGRILDGTVQAPFFPVPVGSTVEVYAEKADHYPRRFEFEVKASEMEVEVPRLVAHRRWEASARYRPQRRLAAGAGVRYYLEPGEHFVASNAAFGVRPDFPRNALSFYNFEADLRLGTYLFRPVTSLVRTGISLGGGTWLTLITPSNEANDDLPAQLFVDPFATIGSAFVELNIERFAPFLEIDLQYGFDTTNAFRKPGLGGYFTVGVHFR